MDISSSPENNRLPTGVSITLTCKAEPRTIDRGYHDRWVNYIEWYDPQNKETGVKCLQPSNRRAHKLKLSCPLVLKNLTVDKFGRYTCQAGNNYRNHCTRKSFEIVIQGKQTRIIIPLINNYSTRACWICDGSGIVVESKTPLDIYVHKSCQLYFVRTNGLLQCTRMLPV